MEKNPKSNQRRAFNKAVGHGKKSKINKFRPTFILNLNLNSRSQALINVKLEFHFFKEKCLYSLNGEWYVSSFFVFYGRTSQLIMPRE